MRYLIRSKRTGTELTLGYDERGLLCELLIANAADAKGIEWLRTRTPIQEADVIPAFSRIEGVTVRTLGVDFAQFWRAYPRKEGKKEAERVWNAATLAKRQLAYDHIQRYRDITNANGVAYLYPATYLRAERWLDNV